MPKRSTERYRESREAVIEVAARLFAAQGFVGTGVAQIGEETGLARGALYYYIESKEGLLAAIHDRVMDPLLTEARVIASQEVSAVARLLMMSECMMSHLVSKPTYVRVFLHEYQNLTGSAREKFGVKRKELEMLVTGLLQEGREQGALSFQDARLATLSWFNLHNYTYLWLETESYFDSHELAWTYSSIFLRGLGVSVDLDDLVREIRDADLDLASLASR